MRNFQLPGRSPAYGINGAAATSHPLATLTAIDVLRRGGNAVDAAIAASAMLCVVEPMSTGIGGDCFALYAPNGGPNVIGLNGSGRAPAAASVDWYRSQKIEQIANNSPHSVTVPGAIDAWDTLMRDHGTMGLDAVLTPAIEAAEQGFAVSPMVGVSWSLLAKRLQKNDGSKQHFLTADENAPEIGTQFKLPALAQTLRCIAKDGRDGFYQGPVAEDMVECLKSLGGLHTLDDFADHRSDYVDPISTSYHDQEVLEIPPNGQGITALIMLNVLKHFGVGRFDPMSSERYHLQLEAQRLAFEARDMYVADPQYADVPVERLLSEKYAEELADRINPEQAASDIIQFQPSQHRDTIYLTVVDRDRNACSFINSIYFGFGSAITAPKSAVMFQNRGAGFVIDPTHPNRIEGGKRPLHTIIPGLTLRNNKVANSFGVMGGDFQPMGHVQVIMNMLDYGMDPQEALDCPRVFAGAGSVEIESGVTESTALRLSSLGHSVMRSQMPLGGGQIIQIDWENGTLAAGSEPRKDGCALAY